MGVEGEVGGAHSTGVAIVLGDTAEPATAVKVEQPPEQAPTKTDALAGYAGEPVEEGFAPPELSYIALFLKFLVFGCLAFGAVVRFRLAVHFSKSISTRFLLFIARKYRRFPRPH